MGYKMTEKKNAINTVQEERQGGLRNDSGSDIVLRIDLDTDTCEVVQTGGGQDAGCGISEKASEWFRNYAVRGYVQEDDLAAYLQFTERQAMREWLPQGGEKKSLTFRRRVGSEFYPASLEVFPEEGFGAGQPVVRAVISSLPL